ncbi:MAG TPA: efflux RND transporter periplasmic adaptor subunit [Verrucomicrobiae bacterium]
MKTKIIAAIVGVLLLVGGLGAVKGLQIRTLIASAKLMAAPPEHVSSFVVREETWQSTLGAVGSVSAVQGVNVTPEIPGLVREITFESGAVVAKGDVLVRLDVSSEAAQLRAVEAQLELARITLERERSLLKDRLVPQSEFDTAEATTKQYQANADAIRTTIEKKSVRAPFAGRLGIRLVNLGQYLEAGKPIVSLQSLTPIFGDFSLPQQDLAQLKAGLRVRLSTDAYPGRQFDGVLSAINPELDQTTRSVGLQATFENPEQLLRPGMFARIEVLLPEQQHVVTIPLTAILSEAYGDSVYVIEAKGEGDKAQFAVRQQFVRTGRVRGDLVAVESGLKPGAKIVGAAPFKLRNGMAVVESNDLTPKASGNPTPADS